MANVFKSEEKETKKRLIEIIEKYLLESCNIEYLYDTSLIETFFNHPLIRTGLANPRVNPIGIRISMDLAITNENKKEGE